MFFLAGRENALITIGAETRDEKTWDEKFRDEKKSGTKKYKKTRDRHKEDPSFQNQNCGSR